MLIQPHAHPPRQAPSGHADTKVAHAHYQSGHPDMFGRLKLMDYNTIIIAYRGNGMIGDKGVKC